MLRLATVDAADEASLIIEGLPSVPDAKPEDPETDPFTEHAGLTDTARKFLKELEERRLNGASLIELRHWAIGLGVPVAKFNALWLLITRSWAQGSIFGLESIMERRCEQRARHLGLYKKAIKYADEAADKEDYKSVAGLLKVAEDALDSLTKLDGVAAPVQSQLDITLGSKQITNNIRDTAAQLMAKMRSIAESKQHFLPPKPGAADPHGEDLHAGGLTPGEEGKSNGHNGSNGKSKLIDIIEAKTTKNTIICMDCQNQRRRLPLVNCPTCNSMRWRAWRETDD